MTGPEGRYRLAYTARGDCEGKIDVTIAGAAMTWIVLVVNGHDEGLILSGMTTGSQAIWQDQFWFELLPNAQSPRIDYWGDRVLWRSDRSLHS